jgi:hypothetical protein
MNATEPTRVEIDDRIREQPQLLAAVTRATEYMQEQAVEVPPPSSVHWRYADPDGKSLQLTLIDGPPFQNQKVQHNYWTRWIEDSVNGKLCVLKSWGELLAKRSDTRMARIDQLIAKLKDEVGDGGEDVD